MSLSAPLFVSRNFPQNFSICVSILAGNWFRLVFGSISALFIWSIAFGLALTCFRFGLKMVISEHYGLLRLSFFHWDYGGTKWLTNGTLKKYKNTFITKDLFWSVYRSRTEGKSISSNEAKSNDFVSSSVRFCSVCLKLTFFKIVSLARLQF